MCIEHEHSNKMRMKKTMKLSNRLNTIIGMVEHAEVVADIGCDHGLVGKALLEQKRAKKVIACDISEKSLEKARKLAKENSLDATMAFRVGDGLSVIGAGEADVVVIAGMGGLQIMQILKERPKVAHAVPLMVLLPHRNEYELRRFLYEEGYRIKEEKLAFDTPRYYQIMSVCSGREEPREEFDFWVGKKLVNNKDVLLEGFLRQRIEKVEEIIGRASRGQGTEEYIKELWERKKKMEELMKCI